MSKKEWVMKAIVLILSCFPSMVHWDVGTKWWQLLVLGIVSPNSYRGFRFPVQDSIRLFYEEDKFSRMMPGGKDFVSLATNSRTETSLSNLKKIAPIYVAYKEKYHDHKIGLSNFCKLRPKWCVTILLSGAYSVYSCITIKTPNYFLTVFVLM